MSPIDTDFMHDLAMFFIKYLSHIQNKECQRLLNGPYFIAKRNLL